MFELHLLREAPAADDMQDTIMNIAAHYMAGNYHDEQAVEKLIRCLLSAWMELAWLEDIEGPDEVLLLLHEAFDEYRAAYVRTAGREWDAERTDMVSDLLTIGAHVPRWYARRLGELEAQHDKAVLRAFSKA
jgi:hypothetical protein